VVTRQVLKTLSLGGGALATWLAVVAPHGSLQPSAPAAVPVQAVTRAPKTADFDAQAERLLARTRAVTQRASTRNPFRFSAPKSTAPAGLAGTRPGSAVVPAAGQSPVPAAPPPPPLTLSGIAEKNTPTGVRRTAVISGDGQLYLVGVGQAVAGLYTVVSIHPEAVVLRDATGFELRLVLR